MAVNNETQPWQDMTQQQQQPMVELPVAPMVASPQPNMFVQPQPMIVQIRKPPPRRYDKYEGVRSRALGIAHIVCAIFAIIINAVGIGIQDRADRMFNGYHEYHYGYGEYYWEPSLGYYVFCGFWCAPMFIICGSFAIFAAKRPTKCPVVACLVLATLSSVFGVTMLAMATWIVADDFERLDKGFMFEQYTTPFWNNTYYQESVLVQVVLDPVAAAWGKKVIVVSVLFLCVSIAELVSSIWIAVITGKVLSTNDPQDAGGAQVQYISNTQAPGQIIILDRHGRPIPDAQVIQVPGPSNMQSSGNMASLMIAGQATQPVQPPTQASSGPVVTPNSQSGNAQPPAYTPVDDSQQHSKTGEDSPPPPY